MWNRTPTEIFKDARQRRTNSICCGFVWVAFFFLFANIFVTYIYNLFNATYEKFNPHAGKISVYRDFPYPMWFPFDVSLSDGYYLLAFLYQPYAYFSLMASLWFVDWSVLSSIIQLQNQLVVVSFALKEIDRNIPRVGAKKISLIKKIRLTKCVEELDAIFRATRLMEELCNIDLLVQNGLAAFFSCTLLHVLSTLTVPIEIFSISTATAVILLESFVQCWVCQNLTVEFSKILEKTYELDWADYPPDLRKFLVIIMVRLQNPTVITLGKWKAIDVSFYIQLLKMTYSFYTLISRQANKNK